MRAWTLLLLLPLAGCVTDGPLAEAEDLEVYRFSYPGSDRFVDGAPHGWMFTVHNPSTVPVAYAVVPHNVSEGRVGPVLDGWQPAGFLAGSLSPPPAVPDLLPANGTRLWLVEATAYDGFEAGMDLEVYGDITLDRLAGADVRFQDGFRFPITVDTSARVLPGDHVQTATVGVWTNGTSFYTNIEALDADPVFPRGYPAADFGGDPLPVYVYDVDRSEQPAGSKDTCHFTTIDGYNALLRTQSEASTGVRYLRPEEAYTSPGSEDHFLYGDALVFMNTVLAIDGATDEADALPDPTGACFDPENTSGPLPVSVPPVS